MALQPEQIDHINIVNWFNYEFPELEPDFHHFANERKCSIQQGRTLKRMGVKKGVLDFLLALPLNGRAGLWIELKVGKNKPTKEQLEFAERKIARGYDAAFVWGFEAAKEVILNYLKEYITNRDNNRPKNLYNGKPIC
jgi:hypothetical protein